jgi:hypothetical protein
MNSYIREFLTTIDARYSDDTSTTTTADWIIKNTRLKRRPFSDDGSPGGEGLSGLARAFLYVGRRRTQAANATTAAT